MAFRRLHVGFDERGEDAVFLLQEVFGRVVLQDVATLHDDDQVGREDGVDAVLQTHRQPQQQLATLAAKKKTHKTSETEQPRRSCC